MRTRLTILLSTAVVVTLAVAGLPSAANAAGAPVGNDVAQPQCSGVTATAGSLPPAPAFAVVGVNGGLANTSNSCFAAQAAWAATATGGTSQPPVSFYVNTANPGLAASWWPDSNQTQSSTVGVPRAPIAVTNPYGACAHGADAACAFVYGYSMALDDATVRGVANPTAQLWWLDVESANSWQPDLAANRASLEGMATYFTGIGARVGVYSTPAHFAEIIGSVPETSNLAELQSWRALGPVSHASAKVACGKPSFTPLGRLAVTQYVENGFDYNLSCLTFTKAPQPIVHGTAKVGSTLSITTNTWRPASAKISYRWYRDGVPIAKATHSKYTLKKADAKAKVTVTVTGKKTGYSTLVKTSAAKKVKR